MLILLNDLSSQHCQAAVPTLWGVAVFLFSITVNWTGAISHYCLTFRAKRSIQGTLLSSCQPNIILSSPVIYLCQYELWVTGFSLSSTMRIRDGHEYSIWTSGFLQRIQYSFFIGKIVVLCNCREHSKFTDTYCSICALIALVFCGGPIQMWKYYPTHSFLQELNDLFTGQVGCHFYFCSQMMTSLNWSECGCDFSSLEANLYSLCSTER